VSALRLWAVALTLGCLPTFTPTGSYACSDGQCPPGFTCDEGVCCQRGASEGAVCPTLPSLAGTCPLDGRVAETYYRDGDGDDAGNRAVSRRSCVPPTGRWVRNGDDCDDSQDTVGPGNADGRAGTPGACDGFDNDCDGLFDEEATNRREFYLDLDGDGFGTNDSGILACAPPPGTRENAGDCNDSTATQSPVALERCNGIDDNCNGRIDDGALLDAEQADAGRLEFRCEVPGARGVCSLGRSICRGGQIVCVPRFSASREVCNGGVDDDCDGQADEAPDCGGPTNLFGPQVRVTARAYASGVGQSFFQQCPESLNAGASTLAVSGHVTNATLTTAQPFLVFSFQPADGGLWDLSAPRNQLNLRIDTQLGGSTWGVGSHFRNPSLSFCGTAPQQLYRLPTDVATGLREPSFTYDGFAPLTAGNGWLAGSAAGYDLASTTSVHLIVRPETLPATVRFGLDAGFSR
jgi:hypothetical protein